jgi:hypothetical protein
LKQHKGLRDDRHYRVQKMAWIHWHHRRSYSMHKLDARHYYFDNLLIYLGNQRYYYRCMHRGFRWKFLTMVNTVETLPI